jgi:MATE family multidrug resistance protein
VRQKYLTEFIGLIKLAIPLIIAQLAQTTISFVDTLMVGMLGNHALAGIAIGSTVFFLTYIVFSGFVLGVSPMVSQAVGARDMNTAIRATRQGLWLSVLFFIPAFVLFWNAHPILLAFGQPSETALDSSRYLRAISWGFLPALGTMALRGLLEGHGNSKPIMVIAFSGIGANIFFNNVLMFGWFGLPALGLVGTGYASSIVYTCIFLLMAIYVHFRYPQYHLFTGLRNPDFEMLARLLKVGGPIAFTLGFECSMFSAAAIAMGTLGKAELAAHQIALQTASVSFMVPLGIAIATSVRVGQAVGRRSSADAELAGHVGMMFCMGVMTISAMSFWLLPRWIIGMYINVDVAENEQVVKLATGFLAIAALFQLADGLQVSAACALRGLKDTFASMVLTGISYWGVGAVAGVIFCFVLDWRGNGLWLGMTLGLATAAVLLSFRFQWKVRRLGFEK